VKYQGKVFDCGSKIGFLTANVVFALDRPDLAPQFLAELEKLGLSRAVLDQALRREKISA
jgi:UTP--glucose-1-phosphate uridylyltransferase